MDKELTIKISDNVYKQLEKRALEQKQSLSVLASEWLESVVNQEEQASSIETQPTIAELLNELQMIHELEPIELESPERIDRPNPIFELSDDDLSL